MDAQAWREREKLTRTELANLLNVHPSLITHIEKGRRNWSPKLAEAMEHLSGGEVHRLELLYPASYPQLTKEKKPNAIKKFFRKLFFRRPHA